MYRRLCAAACLLLASLSAQAHRQSAAELPSLLHCEDGTAVTSLAQWPRRRAELQTMMLRGWPHARVRAAARVAGKEPGA